MKKNYINALFGLIIFIIIALMSLILIFGPYSITAVSTSSMEPTHEGFLTRNGDFNFFKGDLIILEEKKANIGDIILFESLKTGKFYLHRIIGMKTNESGMFYATKGDGNRYSDLLEYNPDLVMFSQDEVLDLGWISEENIIGVAFISVPLLGGIVNSIYHPVGLIFLLMSIFFIILVIIQKETILNFSVMQKTKNKIKIPELSIKIRNTNFLISRRILIVIITIMFILMSFLLINLFSFIFVPNEVKLLTQEGEEFPETVVMSNFHNFAREDHKIGGIQTYLLNMKLLIISKGSFNQVDKITVSAEYKNVSNSNNQEFLANYTRINFLYSFIGTKIVNIGLFFIDPFKNSSVVETNINIHVTFSGILAQTPLNLLYSTLLT